MWLLNQVWPTTRYYHTVYDRYGHTLYDINDDKLSVFVMK